MPRIKGQHADYTRPDMHKLYRKMYPDLKVSPSQHRAVIEHFNRQIREHILSGETANFQQWHLGRIGVVRKDSPFVKNARTINWPESKRQKALGVKQYLVFYTDEYYYKIHWTKWLCLAPGYKAYCFIPTKGISGMTYELAKLLRNDPLAKLKFKPL